MPDAGQKPWEMYQAQAAAQAQQKPWDLYKQAAQNQTPTDTYTPVESGLLGAAQGASLGFADELEGGVKGTYNRLTGNSKDLVQAYQDARDKARARYELAREQNPGSFMTGEVGGGLATTLIPGLNVAKGATLGAKLGTAAALGATSGLGTSTSDLTKGELQDAALDTAGGAALGGVTQGALSGIGAVAKQVTPTNAARKLSNIFLNTPEEITETYINNPQGVLNAPRRFQVAENYQGLLDKLKKETVEGSADSRKILANEGKTISGNTIADILEGKAKQIEDRAEGVLDDPEQLAAVKWLKDKASQYRAAPTEPGIEPAERQLSTNRVKDLLQGIDRSTEYETAPGKFSKIDDRVKKDVRGQFDDLLKGESPAYADQMKKVAEDSRLLENASDIGKSPQGLANTFRRLQTDQYGGGQVPRETLEAFDKRMGSDILDQAKLSTAREAFDKSITNGSMNVQKFSNMVRDVPVIKHLGPIIGATVDKYGRKMTMSVVDNVAALNNIYKTQGPQEFIQQLSPIIDAAKNGNPAAILTYQMLSKSNPEALQSIEKKEP